MYRYIKAKKIIFFYALFQIILSFFSYRAYSAPTPSIQSATISKNSIYVGETVTVSIQVKNTSSVHYAEPGYISISFPNLTNLSDSDMVSFDLDTSGSEQTYAKKPGDNKIWVKNSKAYTSTYCSIGQTEKDASCLAVEFEDTLWGLGETNTLSVNFTPNRSAVDVKQVVA
ncbi:MAG: hypothetical protein JRI32_06040 [Deltaproteobacteria bacterium]|nr:hypothetical protein [Deltaproteobacteria bacterium]